MELTTIFSFLKSNQEEKTTEFIEKSIIENYSIGIIGIDQSNSVNLWNRGIEKMTGLSSHYVIGLDIKEVIPEIPLDQLSESNDKNQKFQKPHFKIKNLDTEQNADVNFEYHPVNDSRNVQLGGIITFTPDHKAALNITDSIFASPHQGISFLKPVTDSDGSIVDFKIEEINAAGCQLTHYERDELIGQRVKATFPHIESNGLLKKLIRSASQREYTTLETYSPRNHKWFYAVVYPYMSGLLFSFLDITTEKHREIEIQNKNEYLENIQTLAKLGNFEWSISENKINCSEDLLEILERNPKENILKIDIVSLLNPVETIYLSDIIAKAMSYGSKQRFEMEIITHKGNRKFIKGILVKNRQNSNKEKIIGYCKDISEIKEIENSLKNTLAHLREGQKMGRIGNWSYNPQSSQFEFSSESCEIKGFICPKIINIEEYYSLINDEDVVIFDSKLKKSIADGELFDFEYRINNREGETIWMKIQGKPEMDSTNSVKKIYGFEQDITESKVAKLECEKAYLQLDLAKEQLRKTNLALEGQIKKRTKDLEGKNQQLEQQFEEFKIMAEINPSMAWACDGNGHAYFLSHRWQEYTGVDINALLGTLWLNFIHPEDRNNTWKDWHKAYSEGLPYQNEQRLRRYDGEYRWFISRGMPVKNDQGQTIKWFGATTDIHDQKRAINELKNSSKNLFSENKELSEKNFDLDNFVYTASHDLKAPITNIEGLVQHLKPICNTSDDAAEIIDMIEASVFRFKNTINDLSEFTATYSVPDKKSCEKINVKSAINVIIQDIQNLAEKNNAKISMDIRLEYLNFSSKHFRSILFNLISNAIKYHHPDRRPEVKISTQQQEGQFLLIVKDNGMGIKKEDQPKLFQMYTRFHENIEGTGIGMYIIKRVIEKAGGKIDFESEEGKGTTFQVYLPLE